MPASGRASPPTERVVAVLDFLARHPHDRFGLSELARQLGLSKPTCLGIVSTLTESGYLVRDPQDKTYRLGSALISLGHIAQESCGWTPPRDEELRSLSATYGATAALSGGGRRPHHRAGTRRARRLRRWCPGRPELSLRPPVGLMFVLWDERRTTRLAAQGADDPAAHRYRALDRVIAECRTSGYLVERLTPGGQRLYALMAGMSSRLPDELQALLGELVSDIGERVYLRGERPVCASAPTSASSRHPCTTTTSVRPWWYRCRSAGAHR